MQSGKISAYEIEKRYIRANGAVMWALLSVGIVNKVDDLPNHYILQIIDITERQRMDEFRGKFVSTVSHELRTPLTSVLGALSLLSSMEGEPLSNEAQRLLYIAQENGNRLHALVDDILDFEKSSAQQMRFTLSRQQIIGLVEDAVLTNMVFAEEFAVRYQIECTDRLLTAFVDPMRFQQVMGNLLTNATKFADKGSTVDVLVESEIGAVRVSIANDGSGIPDWFHSEIFKPFAQAINSKTHVRSGSGLGLNITKQILDQTGGTIGYDSAKDGRTTFWFTVPVEGPY
jgi:signal transduction histidine kinase